MFYPYLFVLFSLLSAACQTGKLTVQANLPGNLKEISAVEITPHSPLLWVIEDAGNKNELYGLNNQGEIAVTIQIDNSKNKDWEELTTDQEGNVYIGDIGNNNLKRSIFTIYKVKTPSKKSTTIPAESIEFSLPKHIKSRDFEAFFLYKDQFYLISKEKGKAIVIAVPNIVGKHTARLVQSFKLDGKNTKITSADISDDGKTVIVLNHDNVWKLNNFSGEHFFDGTITEMPFEHSSQKEGICFKNDDSVYITDEKNKSSGGKLYQFSIKNN
ncbi:SdiA-regulated domain-containing protein [Flavobacteriaceae bacterium F08102]|nr:SdiA-regulated domain-containing protein [Flavobacteriaceae bacterium F08102]